MLIINQSTVSLKLVENSSARLKPCDLRPMVIKHYALTLCKHQCTSTSLHLSATEWPMMWAVL